MDKDYTQGLIALLRRNIGAGRILEVCAEEWEQTFKKDRSFQAETFKRVRDSLLTESSSARKRIDPLKGYLNISSVINKDKTYE